MLCEHLHALEVAIAEAGIQETYRGQAWSDQCREWVYFDCYLDTDAVRSKFPFAPCVREHAHRGTHDGQERGFECQEHWDAVMGLYEPRPGAATFPHE